MKPQTSSPSYSECELSLENSILNMVNSLLNDDSDNLSSNLITTSLSLSDSLSSYPTTDEFPIQPESSFQSSQQHSFPFHSNFSFSYENCLYAPYGSIFNIRDHPKRNSYDINSNSTYFNTFKIQNEDTIHENIDYILYEISPLLIEQDKINMAIYQKLEGKFVSIIKTQNGSRIFQNYLKKTPSSIIQLIYQEIKHSIYDIIINIFGNYFFKKFIKCLHKKDRIEIISIIKPHFLSLSFDNIGTFPIQSIIEQANSSYEQKMILQIIKPHIKEYCSHQNGSHVIETIIFCFGNAHTSYIFDYIITNFLDLSKDPCGICVTKAMIRYLADKTNDLFTKTFQVICQYMKQIVFNQYGNQVIQTVIQCWNCNQLGEIITLIQNDLVELSIGKYSSTVIETFIEKNVYLLSLYIKEISKKNKMIQIMRNCYGNYVIQKAIKISTNHTRKFLIEYISKNVYKLNDQKLISKWLNIIEQNISGETQMSSISCNSNTNNNENFNKPYCTF